MKQQTAWVVVDPKGNMKLSHTRLNRKYVIAQFPDWKHYYKLGYRCRKVIITLDNSKKK